jgi:hypothetical protein
MPGLVGAVAALTTAATKATARINDLLIMLSVRTTESPTYIDPRQQNQQ